MILYRQPDDPGVDPFDQHQSEAAMDRTHRRLMAILAAIVLIVASGLLWSVWSEAQGSTTEAIEPAGQDS